MGEQTETQRFPWGALCNRPQQETQEMMSLPGNRTQQNTETRYPGFTVERSPQQVREQPGYFAVCPFPEARTQESSQAECVETQSVLLQGAPREASGPLPEEKKGKQGSSSPGQVPSPIPPG